jgi:predicted HicB family RNase H-like nuclease
MISFPCGGVVVSAGQNPQAGCQNLRTVPTDLIRRAKSAAALQGVTLREWVLKAIEEKLKKK